MSDTETKLRIERLIASPPEVLFALWIEPAQLLKWWAPDGYEPSVDVLDVRPGGRWRTTMLLPDRGRCRDQRGLSHRRTAAPPLLYLGLGR